MAGSYGCGLTLRVVAHKRSNMVGSQPVAVACACRSSPSCHLLPASYTPFPTYCCHHLPAYTWVPAPASSFLLPPPACHTYIFSFLPRFSLPSSLGWMGGCHHHLPPDHHLDSSSGSGMPATTTFSHHHPCHTHFCHLPCHPPPATTHFYHHPYLPTYYLYWILKVV